MATDVTALPRTEAMHTNLIYERPAPELSGEAHPRRKQARVKRAAIGWVGGVVCLAVACMVWAWCGAVYGVCALVMAGAGCRSDA